VSGLGVGVGLDRFPVPVPVPVPVERTITSYGHRRGAVDAALTASVVNAGSGVDAE